MRDGKRVFLFILFLISTLLRVFWNVTTLHEWSFSRVAYDDELLSRALGMSVDGLYRGLRARRTYI